MLLGMRAEEGKKKGGTLSGPPYVVQWKRSIQEGEKARKKKKYLSSYGEQRDMSVRFD